MKKASEDKEEIDAARAFAKRHAFSGFKKSLDKGEFKKAVQQYEADCKAQSRWSPVIKVGDNLDQIIKAVTPPGGFVIKPRNDLGCFSARKKSFFVQSRSWTQLRNVNEALVEVAEECWKHWSLPSGLPTPDHVKRDLKKILSMPNLAVPVEETKKR